MKRKVAFLICMLVIFCVCSCDYDAPLRNRMLEYYGEDSNYAELNGTIESIEYIDLRDELVVVVNIPDTLTEDHPFADYAGKRTCSFTIVNWSTYDFVLEVNDTIEFTSARFYFYNGHILPIVALWKNGVECMSFSDGKKGYINWIQETFNSKPIFQ